MDRPLTDAEYEELVELRKKIATAIFLMPIERPDFGPMQVRSVEELEVGLRYIEHQAEAVQMLSVFNGVSERGTLYFARHSSGYVAERFPADCGLAPYRPLGGWSSTNWVEKVNPER